MQHPEALCSGDALYIVTACSVGSALPASHLVHPQPLLVVYDLAVQVAQLHCVVVYQSQAAHTGGGEVQGGGGTCRDGQTADGCSAVGQVTDLPARCYQKTLCLQFITLT